LRNRKEVVGTDPHVFLYIDRDFVYCLWSKSLIGIAF